MYVVYVHIYNNYAVEAIFSLVITDTAQRKYGTVPFFI